MLKQTKLVLASVGLFALATGLQADEVTAATVAYNFTAEVVLGSFGKPTIDDGDLIVGVFTYNTSATQTGGGGGFSSVTSNYTGPDNGVTFSLAVGGFNVTQDSAFDPNISGPPRLTVGDGAPPQPQDSFAIGQNGAVSNTISGVTASSFILQLVDPTATVFNSRAVPLSLSLDDFDSTTPFFDFLRSTYIAMNFDGGTNPGGTLVAEMRSLSLVQPVPLPAALPLLLSALGFFGFFGWRRKRMAVAA